MMNRYISENCMGYNSLDFSKKNTGLFYNLIKRLIDVVFSVAFLILFFPLFIAISIIIRIDSVGSPIICQRRAGKGGKIFGMYKFRTMRGKTGYDYSPKKDSDKRITRVGRCLRKTGLDEIPQFANVFLGDMSIVGPRPEMEFIVKRYDSLEKQRLEIKPGITGIWQIKADRKKLIHENLEYDLGYIENRSILLDLIIMLETVIFMIKSLNK